MPTVQSTYSDNISVSYAGAIANEEPAVLISRTVEDSGGIDFGLAVMQGTEDKGITLADTTGFLGVTVREHSVAPETPSEFAYLDTARIMTKGCIYVLPNGAVSAGDPVVSLADGRLGTSTDTPIDGARWDTSSDGTTLAILRLA